MREPRAFDDPERLIQAAIGRAENALQAWREGATTPEIMEHLEKAHYRIENAQRSIAAHHLEGGGAWAEMVAALQSVEEDVAERFGAG